MLTTFLKKQGLSENEAKLYLAAYKIGSAPISILAKQADLNRTTAYGNIKTLLRKGLLTKHVKSDTEYFSAVEAKFFQHYLEERKHNIVRQLDQFEQIMPLFNEIKSSYIVKPQVQYFEGLEGIKQIHQMMIAAKQDIYSFLPIDLMPKKLLKHIASEFVKLKKLHQVNSYIITPNSKEALKLKSRDEKENRTTYLVPPQDFPFETEVTIFGHAIALISLKEPYVIGVLINSQDMANTLKTIFRLCAKSLSK